MASTFSTITATRPPSLIKALLLSLILLLYTSRALPVFSNLHIRLMNPVVQIGKIEIAQQTLQQLLLPALPMFYNYYIVNVIIIILCQLTRFFVHRVKTTIKKSKN